MRKQSLLMQCALVVLATLILLWTVPAAATHHESAGSTGKSVYVCGCGTAAKCDVHADQAGKAPCGKPLIEKQVLKEDADHVYVCACADDCKCALNQADSSKCACGKELRAYPKTATADCPKEAMGGCNKPCANCPNKPAAAN